MARPYLSVIIPAHNEAKRLPITLIDVDHHLSQRDFSYEIIVVVSPGEDATPEIIKRLTPVIKNLKTISLTDNKGKGAAIKVGMLTAKGNWRLTMDADNSISVVEFEKMMPYFKTSTTGSGLDAYEIVIGSRYLKNSQIQVAPPPLRRFWMRLGAWKARVIVPGVSDALSSYVCFSDEAAEKLFAQCKEDGRLLLLETLQKARRAHYLLKEIPVSWSYNSLSSRTFLTDFALFWSGVWFGLKTLITSRGKH